MSKTLFLVLLGLLASVHANRSLKQYDVYGGGSATPAPSGGGGAETTPVSDVTGGASAGAATSTITSTSEGLSVNPWALNQNYGDQTASVGQTITFTWPTLPIEHGLYLIPNATCPTTFQDGLDGQKEIQAPVIGPKTVSFTFDSAKVYWFACPVDGHCDAGMKFKVTVS